MRSDKTHQKMDKESMKKEKEILEQNVCRVIKIDKKALFEFVYENFVRDQEDLLDIHSVEHMNNFTIDWESGEFIFTAHRDEDENGKIMPFPKDIDIQKVLRKIPATTDSVLSPEKIYKDYTFDELREMTKE